jgi:hypothetical protein
VLKVLQEMGRQDFPTGLRSALRGRSALTRALLTALYGEMLTTTRMKNFVGWSGLVLAVAVAVLGTQIAVSRAATVAIGAVAGIVFVASLYHLLTGHARQGSATQPSATVEYPIPGFPGGRASSVKAASRRSVRDL